MTTKAIQEHIDAYDGKVLTEGILSSIWNKVKDFFSKAWEWAKQSFENLMEFLGITKENTDINFNNTINFNAL